MLRLPAWIGRLLASASRSHRLRLGPSPRPVTSLPELPSCSRSPSPTRPGSALLSVDDAGQFLLIARSPVSLGHLRAGRADLLFLADVGALHAELQRFDSLQAGPGWRIAPIGDEPLWVAGRRVPAEGHVLAAGERVRLCENLEFRYVVPAPWSESVVLELTSAAEGCGARQIVLLGPGAGGRVRIGPGAEDHVRVAQLAFEVDLELRGDTLVVGRAPSPEDERASPSRVLPFPPAERVHLSPGPPRGSRAPFGLSLEPVLRPFPG